MFSQTKTINIRQGTAEDLPFIEQMCYEAAFPDDLDERPPFEKAQRQEWFRKYTRDWPNQEGDFGLIAESESGDPLGAAWYRDYPRKEGDAAIPNYELSVALISEARDHKTGQKLMAELMHGAAQRGVDRLALQVKDNNERAKALYNKMGFLTAAQTNEGYEIMVAPTSVVIETERPGLVLRQMLTPKDDQDYFDLQNRNRDFWKEFDNSIDENPEEVTKRRLEHGNHRFGLWLEEELVGIAGYSTEGHEREAEIGILLDEAATGKGIATYSVKALTEYARPRYKRVYADVEPGNTDSINLMKRVGYTTNGEIIKRGWGDALVFEASK